VSRYPDVANTAAEHVFNNLVDEVVLGFCFDIHRAVKTGVYSLLEIPEPRSNTSGTTNVAGSGGTDVFGSQVSCINI